MTAKKSWLKIGLGLGCATLLLGGCLVGLLVWTMMGASTKLMPITMETWASYLGKKADGLSLPHCESSWKRSSDGQTMTCEKLFKHLPFAIAEATGATVFLDKTGHIEAFELELHGYSEFRVLANQDVETYAVWDKQALAEIRKNGCTKHFVHTSTSHLWQCGDSMGVGYSEPTTTDLNDTLEFSNYRGYFWIARTPRELEVHARRRGEANALQYAQLSKSSADILAAKGLYMLADKHYINAAYYTLQASGQKTSSARVSLKDITSRRRQIQASANRERRNLKLDPLLPSAEETLLDLPFLLNKTQDDMEALLGNPVTCKTMRMASIGTYPRCRYGDNFWVIEISFIQNRSDRLAITFKPDVMAFKPESVELLHIPMRPPSQSTAKKMIWKSIANLKELTIEQDPSGQVLIAATGL